MLLRIFPSSALRRSDIMFSVIFAKRSMLLRRDAYVEEPYVVSVNISQSDSLKYFANVFSCLLRIVCHSFENSWIHVTEFFVLFGEKKVKHFWMSRCACGLVNKIYCTVKLNRPSSSASNCTIFPCAIFQR